MRPYRWINKLCIGVCRIFREFMYYKDVTIALVIMHTQLLR